MSRYVDVKPYICNGFMWYRLNYRRNGILQCKKLCDVPFQQINNIVSVGSFEIHSN